MTKSEQNKKWQSNHPLKYKAHMLVNNSVRKGTLPRVSTLVCLDCNDKQARHYHHEDYSQPLNVEALCQKCHTKRHLV